MERIPDEPRFTLWANVNPVVRLPNVADVRVEIRIEKRQLRIRHAAGRQSDHVGNARQIVGVVFRLHESAFCGDAVTQRARLWRPPFSAATRVVLEELV